MSRSQWPELYKYGAAKAYRRIHPQEAQQMLDDKRARRHPGETGPIERLEEVPGDVERTAGAGGAIRGMSCSYGGWLPGRGTPSQATETIRMADGTLVKVPLERDGKPVLELPLDPAQTLATSRAMTEALGAHFAKETVAGVRFMTPGEMRERQAA